MYKTSAVMRHTSTTFLKWGFYSIEILYDLIDIPYEPQKPQPNPISFSYTSYPIHQQCHSKCCHKLQLDFPY